MKTSIAQETDNAPATGTGEKPKRAKNAHVGPQRAHGAPKKAKAGTRVKAGKKAPKAVNARDGSKTARALDLLKRPEGVTPAELMKTTGWQPHSVRGFLSGTVRKKMALTVTSTKEDNRQRSYSIKG